MIALAIAAAVAAPVDISGEHPFVANICLKYGFSEEICAAVKRDCHGFPINLDEAVPCYREGESPYGNNPELQRTLKDLFENSLTNKNLAPPGGAIQGAGRVINSQWNAYAPSFPPPRSYEINPTPNMKEVPPCTTAACSQQCDGAYCARLCTGQNCGSGCTGDFCASACSAPRCGAGAVGRMSAESCGENFLTNENGARECGSGCNGGACAYECVGPGCGTMCTGQYCASRCGSFDQPGPEVSVGCGAHCVGHNCAYACVGLGCGVGARETADEPFTTTCSDYLYDGHCGTLTELAGLECMWTGTACVVRPDNSTIASTIMGMAVATGATAGAAVLAV